MVRVSEGGLVVAHPDAVVDEVSKKDIVRSVNGLLSLWVPTWGAEHVD